MIDSFAPIDRNLVDVKLPDHDGYPDDIAAGDTRDVLWDVCGDASREFPASLWVEPRDWEAKAHENDANHTWGLNYIDRFTNQTPTHECTCHSASRAFESCWNLQRGVIFPDGPKKDYRYPESAEYGSVWVAPLSIYAEANPREWGGAGVRQVLEIAVRRGFLPETIQPRNYGFKHALHGTTGKGGMNQSHGPWLPLSRFPEGWQETGKLLRPLEVVFPESAEQAVSLVLNRRLVCVGRNGHAIPWAQFNVAEKAMAYPDSYDVIRYDSWRTVQSAWRGSFAIISVTAPDDWANPAGG